MEETKQLLRDLLPEIQGLDRDVKKVRLDQTELKANNTKFEIIQANVEKLLKRYVLPLLMACILLLAACGVAIWRVIDYADCTVSIQASSVDRNRVVGEAFYNTYNALDLILIQDANVDPNHVVTKQEIAKIQKDYADYVAKSKIYREVSATHPYPPSPKDSCHLLW